MAEINNEATPSDSAPLRLDQMTRAQLETAYFEGRVPNDELNRVLTSGELSETQNYLRQIAGDLPAVASGNDPQQNNNAYSILNGQVVDTAAPTADALTDGQQPDGAGGGSPSPSGDVGGDGDNESSPDSPVADNSYNALDPNNDGVYDPVIAPRKADDVYGGAEHDRKPLEERLADRELDKKLHPERFEHQLFDGTKAPTTDEHDKALTDFAAKAKAAQAQGPEAVEALLADPKNRALIASTSPEKNSIASNLLRNLPVDELKKLDPAKLSVDPQSSALLKERLGQTPDAPAPTAGKAATPAEEASDHINMFKASMDPAHSSNSLLDTEASLRKAGSPNDPRIPLERGDRPLIHSLVMQREIAPEPKATPKPANDQAAVGAAVKPPAAATQAQHGQTTHARSHFSPGLGGGPGGMGGPSYSGGGTPS